MPLRQRTWSGRARRQTGRARPPDEPPPPAAIDDGTRRVPRFRRPVVTVTGWFLVANLLILLVGALAIGAWVGNQIEQAIVSRSGSIAALYVSSLIESHVESLASGGALTAADESEIDALMTSSSFGDRIVSLRVWSSDGIVRYSPDRSLVGKAYPVSPDLAAAASGRVVARLTDPAGAENQAGVTLSSRLLEMYVPVREPGTDTVIAVAEFYEAADAIDNEIASARLTSWAAVGLGVLVSFLLLFGIVRRASCTIERHEARLQAQVAELSALAERNAALSLRIRSAAGRATTLNERALRRVGADLHDGPAQMLSLALMRLDAMGQPAPDQSDARPMSDASASGSDDGIREVEATVRDALGEIRGIAAGLRLPELAHLTTEQVAARAVDDHTRRARTKVDLQCEHCPSRLAMPVKIALYRALQELLSNASRHGGGTGVAVLVSADDGQLTLEVSDHGPGFDPASLTESEGLGLAGIREQSELLGGGSAVVSSPGGGTSVRVYWLLPPAPPHGRASRASDSAPAESGPNAEARPDE